MIMKEFMTPKEVADEFIDFLDENDLKGKYTMYLYERVFTSRNPTSTLLAKSSCVDEYIHRVIDDDRIINTRIALKCANIGENSKWSKGSISLMIHINNKFVKYFNVKHGEEIKPMLHNGIKLYVRYLKYNAPQEISFFYGSKEKTVDELLGKDKYCSQLRYSIPLHLTLPLLTKGNEDEWVKLKRGFTNYYTCIINKQ